jgi:hypothetical protein
LKTRLAFHGTCAIGIPVGIPVTSHRPTFSGWFPKSERGLVKAMSNPNYVETNPLILSGEYVRVYVADLLPGDVTAFGKTVKNIVRYAYKVGVSYVDGSRETWSNEYETILVKD